MRKGRFVVYFILVIASTALLFPMIYMLCNSLMESKEVLRTYPILFKDSGQTFSSGGTLSLKLIPDNVSLIQYYRTLLRKSTFLLMFWNSVKVTVPIVVGQVFVSALGAYAFAKLKFPFRNQLFFIYIIIMMMPFQVTLVPNYIILKELNLLGSFAAIILPGIFTTFGVFLLRQFMVQIPDEYQEAARIDGAGYLRIFFFIMMPLSKGALASLAILVFIDNWNMVEQPLIFLKDEIMYPLSIFLSRINDSELGVAFACGIIYLLPALFIFLYGEDYLIEGIQHSGLK